jgi:hypothetical protein
MDGDFEMIRALVSEYLCYRINNRTRFQDANITCLIIDALNENNPGLNLGDDAIETLEIAFRRMRDLLLGK